MVLAMFEVLRVDATEFKKNVGDKVKKGEIIGYLKNTPVVANVSGIIQCVYFDENTHELEIIILAEKVK
jgi:predicted deacylase